MIHCCTSYPCPICTARQASLAGYWNVLTPPPPPAPRGWVCPVCKTGQAPWMPYCTLCKRKAPVLPEETP